MAAPRTLDITASNGVPFRVVLLADGQCVNYPSASESEALVEFYDARYPHTPDGQFVARYFLATIEWMDSGLNLDGGVDDWSIDAASMARVTAWLRNGGTDSPPIRTADRVTVHKGDRVWNFYDMKWGVITEDPDNEGWFTVLHDDGGRKTLNGERIASREIRP